LPNRTSLLIRILSSTYRYALRLVAVNKGTVSKAPRRGHNPLSYSRAFTISAAVAAYPQSAMCGSRALAVIVDGKVRWRCCSGGF
jgi:hypothetical protein